MQRGERGTEDGRHLAGLGVYEWFPPAELWPQWGTWEGKHVPAHRGSKGLTHRGRRVSGLVAT